MWLSFQTLPDCFPQVSGKARKKHTFYCDCWASLPAFHKQTGRECQQWGSQQGRLQGAQKSLPQPGNFSSLVRLYHISHLHSSVHLSQPLPYPQVVSLTYVVPLMHIANPSQPTLCPSWPAQNLSHLPDLHHKPHTTTLEVQKKCCTIQGWCVGCHLGWGVCMQGVAWIRKGAQGCKGMHNCLVRKYLWNADPRLIKELLLLISSWNHLWIGVLLRILSILNLIII